MTGSIQIGILLILGFFIALAIIPFERERKRRLALYWSRTCTGTEWHKRFPNVPKQDIREFLQTFVDGFAFKSINRLKFKPDDKVMDIYSALYPSTDWPDALELETFGRLLEEKYKLDLNKKEEPEITLGQLFEMTRNPNKNSSVQRKRCR
ncbi:MAG TPA: hypothetical protein DCZ95_13410 [Verrucomicrobia bacterium]|nr:MAG: hypothetical protein A2X46_11265 [Lentisphaerae bacterium GWF2_57_35]HBA85082.1 hypothetical protein [Verrucomicrobiota bacterium]